MDVSYLIVRNVEGTSFNSPVDDDGSTNKVSSYYYAADMPRYACAGYKSSWLFELEKEANR